MRKARVLASIALVCGFVGFGLPKSNVQAANFWQPGFYTQQIHDGTQISEPTSMAFDQQNNMYVGQRNGTIRFRAAGSPEFSDFATLAVNTGGERGLLGLVIERNVDPAKSYLYALHNDAQSRMNIAKINLATRVLTNIYTSTVQFNFYHNGGGIDLDNLGHLYFSLGDNYLPTAAQDLTTEIGKVHRINKDGSIPADNPFVGNPLAKPTIFAIGFRNPFRLNVDSTTNEIYVGDVGSTLSEEINLVRPARNYGWPSQEGDTCNIASCTVFEKPFYFYNHWTGNSITGGPVYRGTVYPAAYEGRIFFADWSVGVIDTLDNGTARLQNFSYNHQDIVDLEVGADGYLYVLNYFFGKISKVVYNTNNTPLPPQGTVSCELSNPLPPSVVTCAVTGLSDPNGDDATVTWKVNGVAAGAGTRLTYAVANAGRYEVEAILSDGTLTTTVSAAPLIVGGLPTITELATNPTEFSGGMSLSTGFTAVDASGAPIPATGCNVKVQIAHNDHVHDLDSVNACTYTGDIPRSLETDPEIRIKLTYRATDRAGSVATKETFLSARTSTLTVQSTPPGATLLFGGQAIAGTVTGTSGLIRQLAAPLQTTFNGKSYVFTRWSDSVALAAREINFPLTTTTLTAEYKLDTTVGSTNNMFLNPSFENLTADFADNWLIAKKSARGVAVYSFNGQGRTGHGCKLTVSSFRLAAPAFCHQVPMTYDATKSYTFANAYKSTVGGATYALFTNEFGLFELRLLGSNAPSAEWVTSTYQIEPEPGATKIKLFQTILSNGVLQTDDYFLSSN
jgi:glucose/arabinose dehydrogenase